MKKGPGYTLVVLGTMAFVSAGHAQGMTDLPDDRPPVSGPQEEPSTDSDVPVVPGSPGELGPASGAGADLPAASGDEVGDMKGLPPAEGLPEAHSPEDTSPGNTPGGQEAAPSPGY